MGIWASALASAESAHQSVFGSAVTYTRASVSIVITGRIGDTRFPDEIPQGAFLYLTVQAADFANSTLLWPAEGDIATMGAATYEVVNVEAPSNDIIVILKIQRKS